jgi:hypothetical protein
LVFVCSLLRFCTLHSWALLADRSCVFEDTCMARRGTASEWTKTHYYEDWRYMLSGTPHTPFSATSALPQPPPPPFGQIHVESIPINLQCWCGSENPILTRIRVKLGE